MPRDDKATPPVDTDGEEVTVECWENHRYSPFSGWGPTTNGLDRPAWSTKKGDAVMCRESFLLPVGWSWVGSWNVEPHKENMEGWYYGPDFSISTKYCSSKPSRLSMVRRRRWVRTRRNCQAELEIVASVRSMIPRASSLLSSSLSSSIASAWMNIPEPKVFVPEFCFRYSTWTTTACYGFAGATERALASEQSRCHNSFIRLQSLLASTEFFDKQTHHTANQQQQQLGATSPPFDNENNAATPQGSSNNFLPRPGTATGTFVRSPFSASSEGLDALAVARGEVDSASPDGDRASTPFSPFASPNDNSKGKGNDRTESSSPAGFASPLIRGLRSRGGTFAIGGSSNGNTGQSPSNAATSSKIETRVPEKVLHTVYKYGVAPVLRRHLWVAWSGAGAKKAANAGLFQRLAKEAAAIMEKGHTEGTNEMLAEILQDVVRTAPRHPFFEHSQVLSLMKTKKTLALSSGSTPSSPTVSPSSFSPPKRKGVGLDKDTTVTDNAQGASSSKDSCSSSPSPPASPLSTPTSIAAEGSPADQRKAASLSTYQHTQQRLPRPAATTTLSGAIATNTIASHAGGFVDDNSGSYRLALVLVCLALYEKEQADYKRSIDEALRLANAAILGDASTSCDVPDPEKNNNKHGATDPQQRQQQQQLLYKKVPEYHQAFSYMAALLLLNMGEEEAFWTLVCVLEDFLPIGYHDAFQMNTDLRILSEVVRERLPQLEANFSRHQVDMSVFASGWLQGLFCAHFPFATAARILDVMFAEGNSSILVRAIFAFIKLHKGTFLAEDSSCGAGQFANNWARECFDFDDVMVIVASEQKGSSDCMSVIESRRRELYSHGGGHQCH